MIEERSGILRGQLMDLGSTPLRHEIEGKVIREKGKTILHLKKKSVGVLMANITYRLEREGESEKLDGRYEGLWSFGDQEVGTLGIGNDPKIGKRAFLIPQEERENSAHLTLDSEI